MQNRLLKSAYDGFVHTVLLSHCWGKFNNVGKKYFNIEGSYSDVTVLLKTAEE